MADLTKYRALPPKERALIAVAVLLDGRDAVEYLKSDKERGNVLCKATKDLAELAPDLRMALSGSFLRQALAEI